MMHRGGGILAGTQFTPEVLTIWEMWINIFNEYCYNSMDYRNDPDLPDPRYRPWDEIGTLLAFACIYAMLFVFLQL